MLMATRNHAKYLLFAPIFRRYGFEVITLRDIGKIGDAIEESGATPRENALAKARRYHSARYPWVFADDAGLEIDALDGEPGVEARRWNGRFTDDVDDETWLNYLMGRMKGIPLERRTARFVASWVIIAPDGSEHIRDIIYPFIIATERIRPISPGSPISAVRLGPEDDIGARGRDLQREWEAWGILPRLLERFSG